jgi:hypothetical protein
MREVEVSGIGTFLYFGRILSIFIRCGSILRFHINGCIDLNGPQVEVGLRQSCRSYSLLPHISSGDGVSEGRHHLVLDEQIHLI